MSTGGGATGEVIELDGFLELLIRVSEVSSSIISEPYPGPYVSLPFAPTFQAIIAGGKSDGIGPSAKFDQLVSIDMLFR